MPGLTLDPPSAQAEGRLWAVRLVPGASAPQPADLPLQDGPGWVWIHFDLVTPSARQGLLRCSLPGPVATMFSEVDETPRLLSEDGWVAGVLPDFEHSSEKDEVRTGVLRWRWR